MTKEEGLEFIAKSIKNDVDMAMVADAIEALSAEPCEDCEDCISRKAVLDIVDSYSGSRSNVEDVTQDIISDIMALTSVNPKPKTGRWIREERHHTGQDQEFDYVVHFCSECGTQKRIGWMGVKYCPECGAKMSENLTGSTQEKEEEIGPDKKG